MDVDIVVPVWNRPVETRSCLVNLIEYSPGARFILIDNGSERTTERMLQEFAESLDDRALLVCTGANRGSIRAINLGLGRVAAPLGAVVSNTCLVGPGWLDPILVAARQRPDAGVLVPTIDSEASPSRGQKQPAFARVRETSSGSFGAMAIRRDLLTEIGGFDEGMDSSSCLKDYSRRAYRAGYTTIAVSTTPLCWREEVPLGSVVRREEIARRSATTFREKWGEEQSYCIWFPKGTVANTLHERRDILLQGARQGHRINLIVPHAIFRELAEQGYDQLHDNIVVNPPPRFFAENAAAKALANIKRANPAATPVAGIDGLSFPGVAESLPFSSLARQISVVARETYGRQHAAAGPASEDPAEESAIATEQENTDGI